MDQSILGKKVGQLLCVGVPGTRLDRAKLDVLGRVGVGGVILFKANYESVPQLVELTNDIQKTLTSDAFEGMPAFIGVDQEGGRVRRFGAPFTDFPPQAVMGRLNSAKTAFEAGFVMAKELRACGVNVNFAPVVDVPESLDNSVIGDRAFSTQEEVVATMGSALVRGLLKGGVIGVAKHFPGHGVTSIDSHTELPICDRSAEQLENRDWSPFKRAIRARVEGIMTAHILFPKIDPDRPATLSRRILQDQLRKNLRYQKLIFSDDLEMGAIQKKYSLTDAAFLAIEAGCDQVLLCHEWNRIEEVWQHLVKAFESGALPMKKLDEALERIRDAKTRFLRPFAFANLEMAQAVVGSPDLKSVAVAIREGRSVENGPSTQESEAT